MFSVFFCFVFAGLMTGFVTFLMSKISFQVFIFNADKMRMNFKMNFKMNLEHGHEKTKQNVFDICLKREKNDNKSHL